MTGYIILGAVLLLILFILARTLMFRPKEDEKIEVQEISFDGEKAVDNLRELLICRTVSDRDPSKEDHAEFRKLIDKLPKLYPNVFNVCEYTEFSERQLLFRWKGKDSKGNPAVMMAHFDVVPVDEDSWVKPPFEGIIEDGVLWGRGALDTKVTMNGVLSAADHLISTGFVPANDIYFAFSGQEEINGPEADNIVTWFMEHNITPELVVDEGGAVVQDVFPGVKGQCGLIGIAEKGMMNLVFDVESNGGHASAPKPHTPVGELSKACTRVEENPLPVHITKPVAEMFDTLGRRSSFLYRMIFSNLWLFKGVLTMLCNKQGGEMNALMRTTVAFTQMEGSSFPNVIPPEARMVANIRINPDDSVDGVLQYIKKVIKNDSVKLSYFDNNEPSRISRTDVIGYDRVKKAVMSTWKGAVVSPYLMVQCSDSRHYGRISDRVYRFSAMDLTSEERSTIHGHNERIRLDCLKRSVEFYIRLMMQC